MELKYALRGAAQVEEILQSPQVACVLCGPLRVISMDSLYYDTADRALARERIALRRRRENQDTVFTVKTPQGGAGAFSIRGEWEVQCPELADALPALEAQGVPHALIAALTAAPLIPVAHIAFVRKTAPLQLGAELCLDVGALGKRPFAELELELSGGTVEALLAFGDFCAQKFGLSPEPRSKLERALLAAAPESKAKERIE